jgi:hypothetical protein
LAKKKKKKRKVEGILELNQPVYSLDLSSPDFFLIPQNQIHAEKERI